MPFDPAKKTRVHRPPFSHLIFKAGGRTDNPVWAWSGDTLMDLAKFQALKMTPRHIEGKDYLFVEAGGFGTSKKPGWQSQLLVLAR